MDCPSNDWNGCGIIVLAARRHCPYFSGTGEVLIRSLSHNGEALPSEVSTSDAANLEIRDIAENGSFTQTLSIR